MGVNNRLKSDLRASSTFLCRKTRHESRVDIAPLMSRMIGSRINKALQTIAQLFANVIISHDLRYCLVL